MPLFDIFASPRWSPLRMRTKVASFFIFSKSFQTKKIASRGGPALNLQKKIVQENMTERDTAMVSFFPLKWVCEQTIATVRLKDFSIPFCVEYLNTYFRSGCRCLHILHHNDTWMNRGCYYSLRFRGNYVCCHCIRPRLKGGKSRGGGVSRIRERATHGEISMRWEINKK